MENETQQSPLSNLQDCAVEALLDGKFGVFLPYGLGKSRTTLLWAAASTPTYPHLVVLCKRRNVRTWRVQCETWWPCNTTITEVVGTKPQRANILTSLVRVKGALNYKLTLVPYTILFRDKEILRRALSCANVTHLCADESTSIKNPKAKTTKAALWLSKHLDVSAIALSGNPTPEGLHEIWSQFQFASPSNNPFPSTYYRFLQEWFVRNDFGHWTIQLYRERDFITLLEMYAVWMSEKDANTLRRDLGIPASQYIVEYYTLTQPQTDALKQLNEEWALACVDTSRVITYNYILQINMKAQQICGGFFYDEEKNPQVLIPTLQNPKIKLLINLVVDLLRERDTRNIIIWSKFAYERTLIYNALFPYVGVFIGPNADAISQFYHAEGACILMPVDCAQGFNELVSADTNIFFSNDFSAEKRTQAEKRIERPGQKSSVVLQIDLASSSGKDLEIILALQGKTLDEDALTNIMYGVTPF